MKAINLLKRLRSGIRSGRARMNAYMAHRNSPAVNAAVLLAVTAVIVAVTLFVPPYLGLGNDGEAAGTLRTLGLTSVSDDGSGYYDRLYVESGTPETGFVDLHISFCRAAIALDNLVTKDAYFDLRFLGVLYALLFLPGMYLLYDGIQKRIEQFSGRMLVGVVAVLVFCDHAYLAYFCSFYSGALVYICLIWITGCLLGLSGDGGRDSACLGGVLLASFMLLFTQHYLFLAGILTGILMFSIAGMYRETGQKILLCLCAVSLLTGSVVSCALLPTEFGTDSKIHAMTRGVLLESEDPVETLTQFGIAGSYSLLTDESLYDEYPELYESNGNLQDEFLSKYDTPKIAQWYLEHPGRFFILLDAGVRSAFNMRREYCGNFEKSAGFSSGAKSAFFSVFSLFKEQNAPRTLGFYVILMAAAGLIAARGRKRGEGRAYGLWLAPILLISVAGLVVVANTILMSGDAEFVRYGMVAGFAIDLMMLMIFSEIVKRVG